MVGSNNPTPSIDSPPPEIWRILGCGLILFLADEIMRRRQRYATLELLFVLLSTLYHILDLQFRPRGGTPYLTFGDLFIRWLWNILVLILITFATFVIPNVGFLTSSFISFCVMLGIYVTFRIVIYILVALIMAIVWMMVGSIYLGKGFE